MLFLMSDPQFNRGNSSHTGDEELVSGGVGVWPLFAELYAAIRTVNRALITTTDRQTLEKTVCQQLVEQTRYEAVSIADMPTVIGIADNWTTSGVDTVPPTLPSFDTTVDGDTEEYRSIVWTVPDSPWLVVPIVYQTTLYGVLCIHPSTVSISDRERDVVVELGELLGHAITAIERQQLLSADELVGLTVTSGDGGSALATAADRADCRLTLDGLIPRADGTPVAFLEVENGAVATVRETLRDWSSGSVRISQSADSSDTGVLAWEVDEESILGTITDAKVNVVRAIADGNTATYKMEATSNRTARRVLGRLCESFPDTTLKSKRQREVRADPLDGNRKPLTDELTDRQEEVLQTALQAGYFDWPRESTAEEVAATLDITPATLHGHLRKAQRTVFEQLFTRDW